nr:Nerve growth factor family [uncultured bacterium]
MENSNMKGHWIGVFIDKGNETQIDFTENVIPKKVVYETFCKNLFEKTTKAICSGLKGRHWNNKIQDWRVGNGFK